MKIEVVKHILDDYGTPAMVEVEFGVSFTSVIEDFVDRYLRRSDARGMTIIYNADEAWKMAGGEDAAKFLRGHVSGQVKLKSGLTRTALPNGSTKVLFLLDR